MSFKDIFNAGIHQSREPKTKSTRGAVLKAGLYQSREPQGKSFSVVGDTAHAVRKKVRKDFVQGTVDALSSSRPRPQQNADKSPRGNTIKKTGELALRLTEKLAGGVVAGMIGTVRAVKEKRSRDRDVVEGDYQEIKGEGQSERNGGARTAARRTALLGTDSPQDGDGSSLPDLRPARGLTVAQPSEVTVIEGEWTDVTSAGSSIIDDLKRYIGGK